MPRPHIEFLKTRDLDWRSLPEDLMPEPGVRFKRLSEDAVSGASSNLLRYPAGWRVPAAFHLACDEEFYVLRGRLSINGVDYQPGDYALLPAGYRRNAVAADQQTEVLAFYESSLRYGRDGGSAAPEDRLIVRTRTAGIGWGHATDPHVAMSDAQVSRLLLRPDGSNGDRTWLLRIELEPGQVFELPHPERHPCVEEMFLVEGELATPRGTMRDGDYAWRPPHLVHGPHGTRTGILALFRAKEGPFRTDWFERDGPIPWDADYDPVLPDPEPNHRT